MTRDEIILGVMRYYDPRTHVFVPDLVYGIQHPDYGTLPRTDLLVVSYEGGAYDVTVIESRDQFKRIRDRRHPLYRKNYFAVPGNLMRKAAPYVEKVYGASLFVVTKYGGYPLAHEAIRGYRSYENDEPWSDKMIAKAAFLAARRVLTLYMRLTIAQEKIDALEGHNRRYSGISNRDNYDALLDSGMFWDFFPELTGDWIQDRKIIKQQIR